MKTSILFTLLLTSLLLNACKKDEARYILGPVPSGAYVYTSYDSLGTPIVHGWFTLLITDSSHVSGQWHFVQIGGFGNNIGPQVGDCNLVGGFEAGFLSIELNPQFRDNNLSLRGAFDGQNYSGTWAAIGFPGVMNHGTFLSTLK